MLNYFCCPQCANVLYISKPVHHITSNFLVTSFFYRQPVKAYNLIFTVVKHIGAKMFS
jgi:hypothetical protein